MNSETVDMNLLEPFKINLKGINLVEASAGTGKTYNITSLYIRLLIEHEVPVSKILVVTYTEAATKELKDRLLGRIRDSIAVLKAGEVSNDNDKFLIDLLANVDDPEKAIVLLEQAIRSFDESAVYTIHGFCYQALQEQAFDSRSMYDAEMIGDDSELVQEAVDDYWRKWIGEASHQPKKEPLLKLLRRKKVTPDSLANDLGSYVGKPYLKVLPENLDTDEFYNRLYDLWDLFEHIQQMWNNRREDIYDILNCGHLASYTENKLDKWFGYMDEFMESETPLLETFTQFYRFQQSKIDTSLKKGPREKGIQPPQDEFFSLIDEYDELKEFVKTFPVYFKKDLLDYLREEMDRKKEDLQVLSYDDLLLRLQRALLNDERGAVLADKLREKYPVAMVDEFQDTDPCQYDIFRSIYKDSDGALFMIGDPKQSIYSFRGADVYSYIQAREDAPVDKRFRLDRNFRSVPNLLKGLNEIWGEHDRPFLVDDIEYKEVKAGRKDNEYSALIEDGENEPPVFVRRLTRQEDDSLKKGLAENLIAADTAAEIKRLLKKGEAGEIQIGDEKLKARDIAVLVRSHKQADLMNEALQEHNIKSVRHSDQSVFKSKEAEQLGQLLKAVAEPGNETLVKTALALPLTSYKASTLLTIEENEQEWLSVMEKFSNWNRRWREHGFAPMFRMMLSDLEIPKQIIKYKNGERRLTNILHLGELLQREAQNHGKGDRALLHWLAKKRQESDSSSSEEDQLRLESDEALVKIVTMHKSKGLQYPVVFCPFLWKGMHIKNFDRPLRYHKTDDKDTAYLDLSGKSDFYTDRPEKRFYARREDFAESLRLAYVAMTRAQHRLYLSWVFAKESEFSAMGYLLQDPEISESILKAKVEYGDEPDWSVVNYDNRLDALCKNNPELFKLQSDEESSETAKSSDDETEQETLQYAQFERNTPLSPSYSISSFSSLTTYMDMDPDIPDYDQFLEPEKQITGSGEELTMFTFPKGPEPGTCIHNIFEKMDFAAAGQCDDLILEQFNQYGIDEKWQPVMEDMLKAVTKKSLHPEESGLSLAELNKKSIIPEMEFYYRNGEINTRKLRSIIRTEQHGSPESEHPGASAGFLKGFIDLTFEYNGKFYLLDYKSNYLGDRITDYEADQMKEEMLEADYDLQYHIYTVALHRFLTKKMSGYSYDKHFGGAFYLFVRGINENGREGVFFDRPDASVIENLDQYILTGA